jgi:hypothetical protein
MMMMMMTTMMSCRCCIANNEQQGAGKKSGPEIGPNGVKEGPHTKKGFHTLTYHEEQQQDPNVKCHGFPAGPSEGGVGTSIPLYAALENGWNKRKDEPNVKK